MTANQFRDIALSLPEALESEHMGHPDFRVGGKIFATLDMPEAGWAMVKLTPEEQTVFVSAKPKAFVPVKGGWGRKGATNVRLSLAESDAVRDAVVDGVLRTAWCRLKIVRAKGRHAKRRSLFVDDVRTGTRVTTNADESVTERYGRTLGVV
jgi:hypothetical protein